MSTRAWLQAGSLPIRTEQFRLPQLIGHLASRFQSFEGIQVHSTKSNCSLFRFLSFRVRVSQRDSIFLGNNSTRLWLLRFGFQRPGDLRTVSMVFHSLFNKARFLSRSRKISGFLEAESVERCSSIAPKCTSPAIRDEGLTVASEEQLGSWMTPD